MTVLRGLRPCSFLLPLLLLFLAPSLWAQDYAFQGGLVVGGVGAQVDGDRHSGYHRFAGLGGFWVARPFGTKLRLRFEFRYIGKGSLANEGQGAARRQIYSLSLHYLELPVVLEYRVWQRWYVGLGLGGGYLLSASESNQYGNLLVGGRKSFNSYEWAGHARVSYRFNDHLTGTMGAAYSLLPIRGRIDIASIVRAQYNNLVTLSLDYTF